MKESFKPSPGPPAVSCLTEPMQRPVNRLADWHKVLLQPQSGHLTPSSKGQRSFSPGCKDPNIPVRSNPCTPGSYGRSVHCVRREEMYQGRSRGFLGMESLIGGLAAEAPRLHINTFQAWVTSVSWEERLGVFSGSCGSLVHRETERKLFTSRNLDDIADWFPLPTPQAWMGLEGILWLESMQGGKLTPPTCLMWARFVAKLPKITCHHLKPPPE